MITVDTPHRVATWKHLDQPVIETRYGQFVLAERAIDLDLLVSERFALANYERAVRLGHKRAAHGHRAMATVCSQLRAERRGGDGG